MPIPHRRGASNGAAPPGFRYVRHDARDGTVALAVFGELDLATAPALDHALRSAQQRARLVVLNLRRLAFMDCTGLRVLLVAAARAHAGRTGFLVVRGPAQFERLLELTGADRQLETTHAGRNGHGRE
jgi:anti-anti-sigma factor